MDRPTTLQSWRHTTLRLSDLLVIFAIAFTCYAIMPGIGMLAVRRYWARFRARIEAIHRAPLLSYAEMAPGGDDYRFSGSFESAEEGILWIRGERLTVSIDLYGAQLLLLDDNLRAIRWEELESLSEGSRIFVGGPVTRDGGQLHFAAREDRKLIVILYEGETPELFAEVILAGRQKNEYWNRISPYSIALGIFSEILLGLILAERPALTMASNLALTAALGPFLPFIPPGFPLTSLSKGLFRRVEGIRAQIDLLTTERTPEALARARGDKKKAQLLEIGALGLFLVGIAVNALICYYVVRLLH